ncbi:MAG: hypothetical protein ACXVQU_04355, partial [Actinomycetota bacterium]
MKVLFIALGALLAIGATAPSAARSPMVAPGVTVNGVRVGGLGSESARTAVQRTFDRPLRILYGSESWTVRPEGLGVRASVDRAVARALEARAGVKVTLP